MPPPRSRFSRIWYRRDAKLPCCARPPERPLRGVIGIRGGTEISARRRAECRGIEGIQYRSSGVAYALTLRVPADRSRPPIIDRWKRVKLVESRKALAYSGNAFRREASRRWPGPMALARAALLRLDSLNER